MFDLSKVCSTCRDMFNANSRPCHQDVLNESGYRLHHTSPTHFRAAALQQCYICSRNWAKVPRPFRLKWEAEKDKPFDNPDFTIYRFVRNADARASELLTKHTESPALEMRWNTRTPLLVRHSFYHLVSIQDLQITGEDHHVLASFRTNPTVSGTFVLDHEPSTSSLKSLQLIKEWCLDCEENHAACRMKSIGGPPTRLIEIGTTEWRLCYPAKEPCSEPFKFVALSYRWPKVPSIRLLESTEPTFRAGQQISALPRLFQDVMKVSLFLGARYIWIDALCIVQDSLDDWLYESTRMSQVYTNSYCTIAAAASADPDDSLFKERTNEDLLPGFAEVNTAQGNLPVVGTFAIVEKDSWHREFEASVLRSRGWCHQERILAPRTVHFAATQLLWECDALFQNEAFRDIPDPSPTSTIRLTSIRHLDQNDSDVLASGVALREWVNTTESYSRCLLTKESDKLIALSGLATLFHKTTNDTYLAGMWRHNLFEYLMWRPDASATDNDNVESLEGLLTRTYQGGDPTRPYNAPSWSWASYHRGVRFFLPDGPCFSLATILDAQVSTIDGSPFSRVTDGFLSIQGPFFTASKEEVNHRFHRLDSGNAIIPDLHPVVSWDQPDIARPKLVILLLLKVQYDVRGGDDGSINGLVLQPKTESPETYVRIGTFASACDWTKSQCEMYDSQLRDTSPGQHNQRFGYGAFEIH